MTPSNTPITPQINNIADNLGNKHTVVPSDHTHSMSEVTGLVEELEDKADKVHDHKRIIYTSGNQTALVQVSKDSSDNVQIELAIYDAAETEYERKAVLNWNNMANAERAFANPDSVPTANSTNLVTSGGVADALSGKQNMLTFDNTPTANSTNPVTSGGVKAALNQKADTLAVNTALDGKTPLADTKVLYMAIDEDGGRETEIDVDALFISGNTQVSLLIESLAKSNIKLDNVFTSSGRAFTFLTDLVEIPVGAVISCRILFSDAPSTDTKYFVVIDGIWVPQS